MYRFVGSIDPETVLSSIKETHDQHRGEEIYVDTRMRNSESHYSYFGLIDDEEPRMNDNSILLPTKRHVFSYPNPYSWGLSCENEPIKIDCSKIDFLMLYIGNNECSRFDPKEVERIGVSQRIKLYPDFQLKFGESHDSSAFRRTLEIIRQ